MSDPVYTPNSHKYKEQQKNAVTEEKRVQKVVTSPVKTKTNEARKLADIFISEDISNVKNYIFMDVLVFGVFAWLFILPGVRVWRYIVPGNFSIVEDILVGVGEDEVIRRRWRHGYRTIDMLYFEGHGHIPEDKGNRGYGPVGSTFYLVILGDEKQTLHTFYSSQLYYHDPKGA